MPVRFIGMSGVYDIAKHYEYERSRCAVRMAACLGAITVLPTHGVHTACMLNC